jgi:hypothetical protein
MTEEFDEDEFEFDDQNVDEFTIGRKVKIELSDMDYTSWKRELVSDKEIFDYLLSKVGRITPEHDSKLNELKEVISNKIEHPINAGNKKIIIFTAYAASMPEIDTTAEPLAMVWRYVSEVIFNMLVLLGLVKGSDRIIHDMMGL